MSTRKHILKLAVLWIAFAGFACGGANENQEEMSAETDEAIEAVDAVGEEGANPRFGVWRMESDAPPPASNIMTYEPYGEAGMKITVASTSADGTESEWSYVTLFDGVFRSVTGQENAETAVEIVDERTNRILNKRDGEVGQIIVNVLSEDGNTIHNEYRRTLEDGTERVSHAVYRRVR